MTQEIHQNGRTQRKSLASQLDRLDGIIDTLGDGLNEAVADAVKDAVTLAVQKAFETVLHEVLARPELLRSLVTQMQPTAAPTAPVSPASSSNKSPSQLKSIGESVKSKLGSAWSWLRGKVGGACRWVGRKACELPGGIRSTAGSLRVKVGAMTGGLGEWMRELSRKTWTHRRAVTISLLIGTAVGGIGYFGGPVLSSLALGLCSSAMTLAGFLAAPFVRLWKAMNGQAI